MAAAATSRVVGMALISRDMVVVGAVVESQWRRRRKVVGSRQQHRTKRLRRMADAVAAHQKRHMRDVHGRRLMMEAAAAGATVLIGRERRDVGQVVVASVGRRRRRSRGGALVLPHRTVGVGPDPLERGEHGEEVRQLGPAHDVVGPHAGRARRRVERVPPPRLRRDGLAQPLALAVELAQDRRRRRVERVVGGGAGVQQVAVEDGAHGGVAERVGLARGGGHDDGDLGARERAQLVGLLVQALAALGEAHVLGLHALDGLDLDLAAPQRLLPLALPGRLRLRSHGRLLSRYDGWVRARGRERERGLDVPCRVVAI
jgi:hypothetical protein